MSGNPNDHITALQRFASRSQKVIRRWRMLLKCPGQHCFMPQVMGLGVLLVFGALHTTDPGDIHQTIDSLVLDKIRARVIGLAAQVAICHELVSKTNNKDTSGYNVVLNEQHFRELMMDVTTPPVTVEQTKSASTLLMMGFPSRTVEAQPSLCACHAKPSREGYLCSRCSTKVCSLPSECPTCGLTLILSTHLARSYHHLFPLDNWVEVPWKQAARSTACFACGKGFPEVPPREQWARDTADGKMPTRQQPVCMQGL